MPASLQLANAATSRSKPFIYNKASARLLREVPDDEITQVQARPTKVLTSSRTDLLWYDHVHNGPLRRKKMAKALCNAQIAREAVLRLREEARTAFLQKADYRTLVELRDRVDALQNAFNRRVATTPLPHAKRPVMQRQHSWATRTHPMPTRPSRNRAPSSHYAVLGLSLVALLAVISYGAQQLLPLLQ